MGTCGCFKCGSNRFDAIDFDDDSGEMTLRCMECGARVSVPKVFPTDSPDKYGRVFSKSALRSVAECVAKTSKK